MTCLGGSNFPIVDIEEPGKRNILFMNVFATPALCFSTLRHIELRRVHVLFDRIKLRRNKDNNNNNNNSWRQKTIKPISKQRCQKPPPLKIPTVQSSKYRKHRHFDIFINQLTDFMINDEVLSSIIPITTTKTKFLRSKNNNFVNCFTIREGKLVSHINATIKYSNPALNLFITYHLMVCGANDPAQHVSKMILINGQVEMKQ
ncbi:hypothetical protein Glove_66g81 [Diversispora epigaea]|uniref:Uncharacterized protein n=1 Tax=Diversispora epigaea TaxID=1348612 RepID=A0A397JF37_9GLOM|nr:hypothetical protein Glove_66g81 [Diversispora epigaea]